MVQDIAELPFHDIALMNAASVAEGIPAAALRAVEAQVFQQHSLHSRPLYFLEVLQTSRLAKTARLIRSRLHKRWF